MTVFPLDLPSVDDFIKLEMTPVSIVAESSSIFTGSQETQVHAGKWFEVSAIVKPLTEEDGREWAGFFTRMNGLEGSFLLGCPPVFKQLGSPTGTPLVNGANQQGNVLETDGWDPNKTIFKTGDYFQLGTGAASRLYMVNTPAISDGSGNATLDIFPMLREIPANNAPIILDDLRGLFKLTSNKNPWNVGLALMYGVTISMKESF